MNHGAEPAVQQPGTSDNVVGQLVPVSARVHNIQHRALRIKFYANGNKTYQPHIVVISKQKYRSFAPLLNELTRMFSDCRTLRNGVRFVMDHYGHPVEDIEVFSEAHYYICSSTENFLNINYSMVTPLVWRSTAAIDAQKPPQRRNRFNLKDIKSARNIYVIRNGFNKPRRIKKIVIFRECPLTYVQILDLIESECACSVKKLFGLSGREVNRLCDLFAKDDVFLISDEITRPCREDFNLSPDEDRSLRHFKHQTQQKLFRSGAQRRGITHILGSRYEVGKLLGDGCSCSVYLGKDVHSGRRMALKLYTNHFVKTCSDLIFNEVEILKQVEHEHIVQLVDFIICGNDHIVILDLYMHGDLFEYMRKVRKLEHQEASSVVKCTASALMYLHEQNVVHRDVKPENLLIYAYSPLRVKITDFGLASSIDNGPLFDQCGTLTFAAPEIFGDDGYGIGTDIWSLGLVAYIAICGYPPFYIHDRNEIHKALRGYVPFPKESWESVPSSAMNFIISTINTDLDTRFTANDCMNYPWVHNPYYFNQEFMDRCDENLLNYSRRFQNDQLDNGDAEDYYNSQSSDNEDEQEDFSIGVSSASFGGFASVS